MRFSPVWHRRELDVSVLREFCDRLLHAAGASRLESVWKRPGFSALRFEGTRRKAVYARGLRYVSECLEVKSVMKLVPWVERNIKGKYLWLILFAVSCQLTYPGLGAFSAGHRRSIMRDRHAYVDVGRGNVDAGALGRRTAKAQASAR